jgi:hypothetical protein
LKFAETDISLRSTLTSGTTTTHFSFEPLKRLNQDLNPFMEEDDGITLFFSHHYVAKAPDCFCSDAD